MKRGKSIISVILAVLMIMTAVPLASFAGLELAPRVATTYKVGDHIQFGNYPQSQVTDSALIKKLDSVKKVWKSYGYYIGDEEHYNGSTFPVSYQTESSDFMQFSDFFNNGEKYRAVIITKYRPCGTCYLSNESNTFQDENGYLLNKVYYFKYEPLSWRILDPSKGFIMCESIIDSQAYQNMNFFGYQSTTTTSSTYANDYKTSSVREWLNHDFYETAFNSVQKENISVTFLDNNSQNSTNNYTSTTDKIFLVSFSDILSTSFGFSSSFMTNDSYRRAQGTDYAKCQGLFVNTSEDYKNNSWWWLRSPGLSIDQACNVFPSGRVNTDNGFAYDGEVNETFRGIRPACCLSLLKNDIALSTNLFSENNENTSGSNESYAFFEKSYIADIWLNQHKDLLYTYESSELSTFLGYQSISTALVNALLENNWFKGALASWEGFKGIFKTADSIKKISYGIQELYESIIFDLLEKAVEAEAGDYQNIVLSAVESLENGTKNVSPYMKFINDVVGSIGSSADVVRNLYLKDWHKSNISVGTLMNLDSVKQMSDKITANQVSTNLSMFLNEAKSMADFFELVTSYQLAVNMGDEMKAFLSIMKSTTTDPYLESALGTVIAAVDNANWASIVCTTRFAENTAVNVADAIIQGVINSNVYTAVLNIGYKVGKVTSNLLSNTDGIISAYKACVAIDIFTNTSKKVISQLEEKYRSSGTETDAGAYVYAVKTYKDIYILDLERSVNLAKQASQKGIINLTKNKCKSLVNHILDKDETTTYEELCNSVETIKSSLELMFDSLFATWKYNTDYLKTDFPDQYAIYVKGDISSKLYAPQIVSTYLTNDGKVMLNYYNPCVYKDKTGTIHPLFGTAVLEGMKLSEVVNGAVTQELDFAYGFENQRVTLYDKNTFSDFPKAYLLRAYSTDTGSTIYTPSSSSEFENPLKTPSLVWTRGDLGQNCIGIIDETSSRYRPLMVYHIYRKDSRNGSFSQVATLKRDTSITGNLTKYIDTTAQAGKLYIYKVQTEMKFSNGLSLISDESNEYELQGRANSRIDTLALEVNFHGRTMKKTKGIAATAEDGENSVGVIINWISENNPSLYKYELYRKPSYSTAFEKVDCEIKSKVINLLSETRSYEAVDSTVDPGVEYEYLVITYKLTLTSSNGSFVARSTYDPVPIAQGTIQVPANDDNCQHNMMSDVVEEATCSHAGKNKYYCLYCGTEYENTIEELPHTYISSVTFKSTCSENGIKTYSCSVCGDTYTDPIPALGHIDEDNDGKCDREGCGEMMTGGDHCPQCGKIHNGGFFDSIVGFFHKIIYKLTHMFG
ncbi:MAG: hypothetical protein IJU56_03910 [Clostridia bacterium]|nr:hypothetical protein [Clostridia bacterium]